MFFFSSLSHLLVSTVQSMRRFESLGCDSPEEPRFILCSLKACGTGINLTHGNHVCLFDVWWNEAAEAQAYDRVHRIGQTRPVTVLLLVMEDSIEERMIQLQQAKAALGKGSLEKLSPTEQRQARLTALKDLFQIANSMFDAPDWDHTLDDDYVEDDDDEATFHSFLLEDDVGKEEENDSCDSSLLDPLLDDSLESLESLESCL
jgi:hypothetical protein